MSQTMYYHATTKSNFLNILADGQIHTSVEGVVYVCKSPGDAAKFAYVRSIHTDSEIVVAAIKVPSDVNVVETFDHSEKFFQCKCYGIERPVPTKWLDMDNTYVYNFSNL